MQELKRTVRVAVIDDGIHESVDSVFATMIKNHRRFIYLRGLLKDIGICFELFHRAGMLTKGYRSAKSKREDIPSGSVYR